jgi:hypothetical protein
MSEENKGDFICDECKTHFYVGQGFLGSLSDFEFQMNEGDVENQEQFECSPFMNYVQLCNSCLTSKQIENESNNQ